MRVFPFHEVVDGVVAVGERHEFGGEFAVRGGEVMLDYFICITGEVD
jgi:hypothetical protein